MYIFSFLFSFWLIIRNASAISRIETYNNKTCTCISPAVWSKFRSLFDSFYQELVETASIDQTIVFTSSIAERIKYSLEIGIGWIPSNGLLDAVLHSLRQLYQLSIDKSFETDSHQQIPEILLLIKVMMQQNNALGIEMDEFLWNALFDKFPTSVNDFNVVFVAMFDSVPTVTREPFNSNHFEQCVSRFYCQIIDRSASKIYVTQTQLMRFVRCMIVFAKAFKIKVQSFVWLKVFRSFHLEQHTLCCLLGLMQSNGIQSSNAFSIIVTGLLRNLNIDKSVALINFIFDDIMSDLHGLPIEQFCLSLFANIITEFHELKEQNNGIENEYDKALVFMITEILPVYSNFNVSNQTKDVLREKCIRNTVNSDVMLAMMSRTSPYLTSLYRQ